MFREVETWKWILLFVSIGLLVVFISLVLRAALKEARSIGEVMPKKEPLLCRWLGHKWLDTWTGPVGTLDAEQKCARFGCPASRHAFTVNEDYSDAPQWLNGPHPGRPKR